MPLGVVPPAAAMDETADKGGNWRLWDGDKGMQLMAGSARESMFHTPEYPSDVVESTAGACEVPTNESDRTRPGCPSHCLPADEPAPPVIAPAERQVMIEGGRGGHGGARAERRSNTASGLAPKPDCIQNDYI